MGFIVSILVDVLLSIRLVCSQARECRVRWPCRQTLQRKFR